MEQSPRRVFIVDYIDDECAPDGDSDSDSPHFHGPNCMCGIESPPREPSVCDRISLMACDSLDEARTLVRQLLREDAVREGKSASSAADTLPPPVRAEGTPYESLERYGCYAITEMEIGHYYDLHASTRDCAADAADDGEERDEAALAAAIAASLAGAH